MRKLFVLYLAVMLVVCAAGYLWAAPVYTRGPDARAKTEIFTSAAQGHAASDISSSNRLLGYDLSSSVAGSCVLVDTTSTATAMAATSTGVICEAYVAAGAVTTIIFPLPIELDTGLTIVTKDSTANSGVVTVYYE